MTIKDVLTMGDPRLNQVAEPVRQFDTAELHGLIKDMKDTMDSLNGVGLAAPQIAVSKQVVIFGSKHNARYSDQPEVPETVLINPVIEVLSNHFLGMWEGCLSVPGMRGYVERPAHIRYYGVDQFGEPIDKTATDFHAVVVQHECDHLNGILYPRRIKNLSQFGFEEHLAGREDFPPA